MLRGIMGALRSRRWLSSAPSDGGPTAIGQHIERLVGELADVKEGESIHLDRLRSGLARQSIDVAVLSLEKELHQEMASALGRSGRTIDLRCLQLELAQQALAKGAGTKDAVIAAHGRAMTARQELIIHRVAIGMRGAHQTGSSGRSASGVTKYCSDASAECANVKRSDECSGHSSRECSGALPDSSSKSAVGR